MTCQRVAILTWLGVFFACGWIGTGSKFFRRTDDSRILSAIGAGVMAPDDSYIRYPVPGHGGNVHNAPGLACGGLDQPSLGPDCVYLKGILGYRAAMAPCKTPKS